MKAIAHIFPDGLAMDRFLNWKKKTWFMCFKGDESGFLSRWGHTIITAKLQVNCMQLATELCNWNVAVTPSSKRIVSVDTGVAWDLQPVWSRFEANLRVIYNHFALKLSQKNRSYGNLAEPSYAEFVPQDLLSSTSNFFAVISQGSLTPFVKVIPFSNFSLSLFSGAVVPVGNQPLVFSSHVSSSNCIIPIWTYISHHSFRLSHRPLVNTI